MLQLKSQSPFRSSFAVLSDKNGQDVVCVYLRGIFDLDGKLLPGDLQELPQEEDAYYGEPLKSSLRTPCDFTLGKPVTDVLLHASAYAPDGKPVETMRVRFRVGDIIDKTVAVFGNRVWEKHGLLNKKLRPSAPEKFESMPLRWEHAFGGADQLGDDEATRQEDPRNPLGVGFVHPKQDRAAVAGRPLPNLENSALPLADYKSPVAPVGFGPLASHWQPRLALAGTYDEAWQKKRAPRLPQDFDPRFFNTAPADQIVADYLQGGEPVEITGVTPDGQPVKTTVPAWRHEVRFTGSAGRAEPYIANLETCLFDLEARRLTLTYAACHRCGFCSWEVAGIRVTSHNNHQPN
jgi:hypothetical protein